MVTRLHRNKAVSIDSVIRRRTGSIFQIEGGNDMNLAAPTAHRNTRLLLSGLLVIALTGCGDGSGAPVFERAANALGITDPPAPAALSVDILCDLSEGAPCTPKNLSETISGILPILASRPGSEVRLWVQGEDVSSTEIVSTITVPHYKNRRRHTLELEE